MSKTGLEAGVFTSGLGTGIPSGEDAVLRLHNITASSRKPCLGTGAIRRILR